MLKEKDCSREDRVLPIIGIYPIELLPTKQQVETRLKLKTPSMTEMLSRYYNWVLSDNEIVVYIGYGYCELKIPKTYNYLINFNEIKKSHRIRATVKFAINNGRMPLDFIGYGDHTICVIEFSCGIPEMLNELPSWDDIQKGNYDYNKIGLCDVEDVELVIKGKVQG